MKQLKRLALLLSLHVTMQRAYDSLGLRVRPRIHAKHHLPSLFVVSLHVIHGLVDVQYIVPCRMHTHACAEPKTLQRGAASLSQKLQPTY